MKKKLGLILLTTLCCTCLVACSSSENVDVSKENTAEDSVDIEVNEDIANGDYNSLLKEIEYEEISLDKMGEYEYDYTVFITDTYDLGYINIEYETFKDELIEIKGTLDFSGGAIYPLEFDYNGVETNLGTNISAYEKGYVVSIDGYSEIDSSYFSDAIPEGMSCNLYSDDSYLILVLHNDNISWSITDKYANYEDVEICKETIKQSISCICSKYNENALSIEEYQTSVFKNVKLNTNEFDFSDYNFENVPYCWFTYEDGYKIRKIDELLISLDDENNKRVSFSWHQNDKYVNDRVRSMKENTVKMYESVLAENLKIRVYEYTEGNFERLGIIKDGKEYIQSIHCYNLTIDELYSFLGNTIMEEN